jgi:fructose-1,6-bisphosphatase I
MLRTATYTVTLVALAVIVTAAAPEVSRRLFQVPHFRPQGAATQHGFLPPIITDLPGGTSAFRMPDPHMTATLEKAKTKAAPKITAACEHTGVTLTRFMLEVSKANPDLEELPALFSGISTACKAIANAVKRSQLTGLTGLEGGGGSINVQGEEQKKLDVLTNEILKRALYDTGKMGVLASEEEDTPVDPDAAFVDAMAMQDKGVLVDESQRYVAVFDPLDGSSNVDAGIPTGTIFGIYDHDEECPVVCDGDECTPEEARCLMNTLQPGTSLVASGYALYSSSTFFVFSFGAGVHGFTLDENIGEFVLTHPEIHIPEDTTIYSINEANFPNWDAPLQKVVNGWQTGTGESGKKYTSRYMGSMVGDVHRTFMYGGVFGYPADTKNKNGKLRLVYEAAPIAFLVEQAGGIATTGTKRVMDIVPEEVHQRLPVILGSKKPLQEVLDAYESKASAPEIPAPLPYTPRKPFVNAPETPKSDTYVAPKITAACEHTGVTLTRFMLEVAKSNPDFNELPTLFSGISTACKAIANLVKRSQLTGLTGYEGGGGSINVQGEEQKKLDVLTNDVLKKALYDTGKLGVLASEEEDAPVDADVFGAEVANKAKDKGILVDEGSRYVAVFDPLDGSSNVDAGIATGTIFGIYDHDETCPVVCEGEECTPEEARCLMNTLQPGNKLVASGYALYSSSTFFVFTFGAGVYGFTLDENIGEFVLTHPDMKIPETASQYSMNEANLLVWDEPIRKTVESWRVGEGVTKKTFSSRYIGSMVADVHRTLLYGGLFAYPADPKNTNGKLRLVYEAAPMAFLLEQAGGKATTGTQRILDIAPEQVHQRVPIVLGSATHVKEIEDAYAAAA